MRQTYPLLFASRPLEPNLDLEVCDKYSGEVAARVPLASPELISQAIDAAAKATRPMAKLKAYERQEILQYCVKQFEQRQEELAETLCVEAGKPIRDSQGEVTRLIDTFRIAAEESIRITGEIMPLDISARAANYRGMWRRVPIGACSFISPFNFPLNLTAHKIAPAIAAGCPFVLKPASLTPIGALIIGEVLAETGMPEGAFSILPCRRDGADLFTTDPRLKLLSFTGSPEVGWKLKSRAGAKKVVLELGGNAACIVDADANLDDAVARIIIGAFYQSGQSCISVQRIFAHRDNYEDLKARLIAATAKLKSGDPKAKDTFIGPMITEGEAERVETWIADAVKAGAKLLIGGERNGAMVEAALLENVPTNLPLSCDEVFGPVAILAPFDNFNQAIEMANDTQYGLQVGIFTRDVYKILTAWDEMEVGGVIIGDVPSWRVDHMPYGGVKNSGLGREGIRFAIEDMTEIRNLVIRNLVIREIDG
ncbi:aldehyde dehydrogenase family protein [Blastopirellula sp. JC732]|uniref:Aldehyde dehydrogenase family protein n=1 Tax=Blastopirellula sediminis TaxID=2894196 RepID=A0A9X1MJF9_9BACT|nr:aldehyde dehydrogenase family protein [Blastopirellula sediminis]MCC9609299.1 aldehyde dehydrogenase family protein [Blastopirellula sediminis]MCC9627924.1 aldehyde dehydrogenase family protein [Blastopirellula sediminis]